MADTYPTKNDYSQDTLSNDGGSEAGIVEKAKNVYKKRSAKMYKEYTKGKDDMLDSLVFPDDETGVLEAVGKSIPGFASGAVRGLGRVSKAAAGYKRGGEMKKSKKKRN